MFNLIRRFFTDKPTNSNLLPPTFKKLSEVPVGYTVEFIYDSKKTGIRNRHVEIVEHQFDKDAILAYDLNDNRRYKLFKDDRVIELIGVVDKDGMKYLKKPDLPIQVVCDPKFDSAVDIIFDGKFTIRAWYNGLFGNDVEVLPTGDEMQIKINNISDLLSEINNYLLEKTNEHSN